MIPMNRILFRQANYLVVGINREKISHLTVIEEKEIKTLAVFDTFIFVKEDKKKRLVFQYNKSTDLFHLL